MTDATRNLRADEPLRKIVSREAYGDRGACIQETLECSHRQVVSAHKAKPVGRSRRCWECVQGARA